MSISLQMLRDTAANLSSFVGKVGQLVVDTTNSRLRLCDGVTAGGIPLSKYSEVNAFTITLTGVNFNNANSDNAVTVPNLPPGCTRYAVSACRVSGASAGLTSATAGVFTGAGGTGVTIANSQSLTVSSASDATNNNAETMAIVAPSTMTLTVASYPTLYFRVGTPVGSPATANVSLTLVPLP